jgi:crotonobetainyl-CoA:carnitine CoA-transferase CaiB-like acyl-CoA transferase
VPEIDYMPGQFAPAMGDSIGGLTIAGGISAALLHRERTGEAPIVDVSLLATGMWAISAAIALTQQAGEPWSGRMDLGINTPRNPLVGNFVTADSKWLAFSMLQGFAYWAEMCVALGIPELIDDPRFTTHELLFANGSAAAELVKAAIAAQPIAVWKERLRDVKGQWAPVQDSLEISEDPMVIANGYLGETKTQHGVPIALVTTPVQFDEAPSPPGRSPGFNEHGDDILRDELGLGDDAIIDLKIKGVVA